MLSNQTALCSVPVQLGCFLLTFSSVWFPYWHLRLAVWLCWMHSFTWVSQVCFYQPAAAPPPCILALGVAVPRARGSRPVSFCFIVLFFSPEQIIFLRLTKDVSRPLSGICRLSPVLLQFSLPCYVLSFLSILRVHLQLTSCTKSRLCTVEKNKHPFLCVDCISWLCPVFSSLISVYSLNGCLFSAITLEPASLVKSYMVHCSLWAEPMQQFGSVTGGKTWELERFSVGEEH